MKIMIAYPALEGKGSPMLTQNRQFQWYHVGSYIYPVVSATAATLLKEDGFEPVWYDGIARRHTPEQFWRMLTAERPHLIVMESKTPVIRQHWKMIRKIKSQYPKITHLLNRVWSKYYIFIIAVTSAFDNLIIITLFGCDIPKTGSTAHNINNYTRKF